MRVANHELSALHAGGGKIVVQSVCGLAHFCEFFEILADFCSLFLPIFGGNAFLIEISLVRIAQLSYLLHCHPNSSGFRLSIKISEKVIANRQE
jgi:hypothetical protein